MDSSQKEREEATRYRGNDPLQASWSQSRTVNTAWLKNGESLSILQRIGFTLFSLLFVAIGLYLIRWSVVFLTGGDFMLLIFVPASFGFLFFGVLGLRNVLRFRKDGTDE